MEEERREERGEREEQANYLMSLYTHLLTGLPTSEQCRRRGERERGREGRERERGKGERYYIPFLMLAPSFPMT